MNDSETTQDQVTEVAPEMTQQTDEPQEQTQAPVEAPAPKPLTDEEIKALRIASAKQDLAEANLAREIALEKARKKLADDRAAALASEKAAELEERRIYDEKIAAWQAKKRKEQEAIDKAENERKERDRAFEHEQNRLEEAARKQRETDQEVQRLEQEKFALEQETARILREAARPAPVVKRKKGTRTFSESIGSGTYEQIEYLRKAHEAALKEIPAAVEAAMKLEAAQDSKNHQDVDINPKVLKARIEYAKELATKSFRDEILRLTGSVPDLLEVIDPEFAPGSCRDPKVISEELSAAKIRYEEAVQAEQEYAPIVEGNKSTDPTLCKRLADHAGVLTTATFNAEQDVKRLTQELQPFIAADETQTQKQTTGLEKGTSGIDSQASGLEAAEPGEWGNPTLRRLLRHE